MDQFHAYYMTFSGHMVYSTGSNAMAKRNWKYVKDLEDALLHADPTCVFITHSGCEDELLEEVRRYLESLDRFENIYTTRAGGVISSHCGPGTLGVLFYAD